MNSVGNKGKICKVPKFSQALVYVLSFFTSGLLTSDKEAYVIGNLHLFLCKITKKVADILMKVSGNIDNGTRKKNDY